MNSIEQLSEWVRAAKSIAVLTGAGISTGSGIPDFRSAGGIYSDERNVNVFDLPAFRRDPSIYYKFAREFYSKVRDAQPNVAHRTLARWTEQGRDVTVITQNVDDYHQRAGSSPVCTVHGTYIFSTCQSCGARTETETLFPIIERGDVPHCVCGGVYKPDITFFGELVPESEWNASVRAVRRADLLLVLGTSLSVYPAAVLPSHRPRTCRLVVINRNPTQLDREANLVIHDDLCSVMRDLPHDC